MRDLLNETPAESVERDVMNENRQLRERVRELEWELERVRSAWRLLSRLADEPSEATS